MPTALDVIFAARPDVLNHNLETVARLQRAGAAVGCLRPLARAARRAKDAGLVTKSGIILGMGETDDEVRGAIADLRNVGVDILTLGQYLRPSPRHLPVVRWWTPDEFADVRRVRRGARVRARRGRAARAVQLPRQACGRRCRGCSRRRERRVCMSAASATLVSRRVAERGSSAPALRAESGKA